MQTAIRPGGRAAGRARGTGRARPAIAPERRRGLASPPRAAPPARARRARPGARVDRHDRPEAAAERRRSGSAPRSRPERRPGAASVRPRRCGAPVDDELSRRPARAVEARARSRTPRWRCPPAATPAAGSRGWPRARAHERGNLSFRRDAGRPHRAAPALDGRARSSRGAATRAPPARRRRERCAAPTSTCSSSACATWPARARSSVGAMPDGTRDVARAARRGRAGCAPPGWTGRCRG